MIDIFNSNNLKTISESEYLLAQKNLHNVIFSRFYKKGLNKDYVVTDSLMENLAVLKEESPTFAGYEFSLEHKEQLYHHFGKIELDEKLSENNKVFRVLKEQVKKINEIIEPVLNDLGINYELHLSGGSMRDHLLDREIKDLDLLIEFHDDFQIAAKTGRNSEDKSKNLKESLEKFFTEKSSAIKKHNLDIFHGQSREKILHEIIFQTMKKNQIYEIKDFFWEHENENKKTEQQKKGTELTEEDSMIYDGLFSVLKVNNETLTYPIDLLLNGNKFSYLNSFDFDICKCAYTFKSLEKQYEPLYMYDGFIRDVIESKLSLNACIFHETKQVDRCLKDHYLRVKHKYPTHTFQLLEDNSNKEMIEYISKAQAYHALGDKLKDKENMPKTKVKKI